MRATEFYTEIEAGDPYTPVIVGRRNCLICGGGHSRGVLGPSRRLPRDYGGELMSSDNYYTVRQSEVDGLWYVRHGFMSDGPTAVLRRASEGFATRAEAVEFYLDQDHSFLGNYYSEYGLVP